MSRAVLLLQLVDSSVEPTVQDDVFPAGMTITVEDGVADDLVLRGYAQELTVKGTATIASGTSSVTVAHGLGAIPSEVSVTGQHSEVAALWVTNATTSQFTVNVAANTTGNRNVYWGVR